jgi:hypothetical protein
MTTALNENQTTACSISETHRVVWPLANVQWHHLVFQPLLGRDELIAP